MQDAVRKKVTLSGTTPAGPIDLSGHLLAGFYLPAGFDSTALTFQVADEEGGTYLDVYDSSGTEISVTCAAERHILIEPQTFAGARWLKVVPDTSQSPDLEITLVLIENV